jgi:hypothetical protein
MNKITDRNVSELSARANVITSYGGRDIIQFVVVRAGSQYSGRFLN